MDSLVICTAVRPSASCETSVARRMMSQTWACSGWTDIHQKAHSAGEDAHYGDHGAEQAP